MKPEYYEAILERLQEDYQLTVDRTEHQAITEFFEGLVPLFKLILAEQAKEQPSVLIVSFNIDLDSSLAVEWFLRLRNLDPNLHISACYLKDPDGVSYVGEDAEIMRMYMIEQDILSHFIQSDRDSEDIINLELPSQESSSVKVFSDYNKALAEFLKMKKSKSEKFH